MKSVLTFLIAALVPLAAFAQTAEDAVERSSSPSGMVIHGQPEQRNAGPTLSGSGHPAAQAVEQNTAATARNSVNLRGNTRVDAQGQALNSVASGNKSKAENSVGTIGDQ